MEAKLAEMAEGKPQTCAIIANVYERTEVDSEDTEKEDQRSGGSEVKQKGSSAVASTSKGIKSRHVSLFCYVIDVSTCGPMSVHYLCIFVPREQNKLPYINNNNALDTITFFW